jgi:hypothetical protein
LPGSPVGAIYGGTTGIQANYLVGRKAARDGGASAKALAVPMKPTLTDLPIEKNNDIYTLSAQLSEAIEAFEQCVAESCTPTDANAVHAGAVPFLKLGGLVCGDWLAVVPRVYYCARLARLPRG